MTGEVDLPKGSMEISRVTIVTVLTAEGEEVDCLFLTRVHDTKPDVKSILGSLTMAADTVLDQVRQEDEGGI